jgi:hypothetical protein
MKYKELKNYKYELVEKVTMQTRIFPAIEITEPDKENPYIILDTNAVLVILKGYTWDGPSGITIDTRNFMRGSLVHDALYQLMRQNKIGLEYREYADNLLYEICVEDGMSKFRARYVLQAVRMFGASSAYLKNEAEIEILEAP